MLDAVTISVRYADYLRLFLMFNRRLFDRIMVATVKDDDETISVCKEFNVQYVITDRISQAPDKFNRGKGMNDAIKALRPKDWVALIDADILLTKDIRPELKDQKYFYSTHRNFLENWSEFLKWLQGSTPPITHPLEYGYGFLQIIHASHPNVAEQWFNEGYPDASGSDVHLRERWTTDLWRVLFDHCIHLGPGYKNWAGRETDLYFTKDMYRVARPLIDTKIAQLQLKK